MKKKLVLILLFCLLFLVGCKFNNEISVEKIDFSVKSLVLEIGESRNIGVTYSPVDATEVQITYSCTVENVVDITDTSNYGCVLTALAEGSTILIAECNGVKDYLEISVEDNSVYIEPYIILPYVTLEMNIGQRKNVIATLNGRGEEYNNQFSFKSDNDCVLIDEVGNTCVINAIKSGVTRVTVTHPVSNVDSSFLVYVVDKTKDIFYLTTNNNVIKTYVEDSTVTDFNVDVVGGNDNDKQYIDFDVVEGQENIKIVYENGKCSITAIKVGNSKISVSHYKAEKELFIDVVISSKNSINIIEVDKEFIVIDGIQTVDITANFVGEEFADVNSKYSFEIENNEIIEVIQSMNSFHIRSLKDGKTKLIISNEYSSLKKEIFIVVENTNLVSTVNYISVDKSYLKLEKGQVDIPIKVRLIGGNESDKNNFIYTIKDKGIVDLTVTDGNIIEKNSRKVITLADVYETSFLISSIGIGETEIEITHPKSSISAKVTVKVYPKGTLTNSGKFISGSNFIKILKGESTVYNLNKSGFETINEISWVADSDIVELVSNGLSCNIKALKSGRCNIEVSSAELSNKHIFQVIVCETQDELDSENVFFVNDKFIDIGINEKKYIEIETLFESDGEFSIISNNTEICYSRISSNILVLEGLNEGNVELHIKHSKIIGEIVLFITCIDFNSSYEYPYTIKTKDFVSLLLNTNIIVDLELEGASDIQYEQIQVLSNYGNVNVSVKDKKLYIEGIKSGEDIITIGHPKCKFQKNIYVFVAETQVELDSKIILYAEKFNYIVNIDERLYLTLGCNKTEEINNLIWKVSDTSIIEIEVDGNNALITGLSEGCTQISVSHSSGSNFNFYISVIENNNREEYEAELPSIVEMIVGNSKNLNLDFNITNELKEHFKWEISDKSIIDIYALNENAKITALKEGFCELTILNESIGFKKIIGIVVRNSVLDFEGIYVMGVERTVNSVFVDNSIRMRIDFGTYKLDEILYQDFELEIKDTNIVEAKMSSNYIDIKGINAGSTEIYIRNKHCINSITLIINVYEMESNSNYSILINSNIKVLTGTFEDVLFTIINNSTLNEVYDYSSVNVECSSEEVSITNGPGFLRIKTNKNGIYKIKISSVVYNVKQELVVYSLDDENKLNNSLMFSLDKNYYMIKKGESINLNLRLSDEQSPLINSIEYLNVDNSIIELNVNNYTNFYITGLKEGSTSITIKCEDYIYIINISVIEFDYSNDNEMFVEGIINLLVGETYESKVVGTNVVYLDEDESELIDFSCEGNIISITGLKKGQEELVVYNSNSKKVILVNILENEEELKDLRCINIVNRSCVIQKGQSILVKPIMYPNFNDINNVNYELTYNNSVVQIEKDNEYLKIDGIEVGIEKLKVSCPGYNNLEFEVIVKESEVYYGKEIEGRYLTTDKEVYYLNGNDKEFLRCYIYEEGYINYEDEYIWECSDESLVQIEPNGNVCYLNVLKASGKCFITVKNSRCSNTLTYQIIVGDHYINNGIKYKFVKLSRNSVSLIYNGNSERVELELNNIENGSFADVSLVDEGNGIIEYSTTVVSDKMYVDIKPLMCGSGRLKIIHPCSEIDTYIDYVVNDFILTDSIYLTTSDNYSVVRVGDYKEIKATLMNYEEIDSGNFNWNYKNDCILILGEGNKVSIYGIKEGESKVTLSHPKSKNQLEFTVVVSNIGKDIRYITGNTNLIETQVSSVMDSFSVNIVGSSDESLVKGLNFEVEDPKVLSVVGNNDTCFYRGLKKGITKINVSHNDQSIIPFSVTVVVEDVVEGESYLSCENKLNYLEPFGNNKRIEVNVENIDKFDLDKFSFYIYSQKLSSNSEGNVIKLVSSQNKAVITPENEGTAKIRCIYTPLNLKLNIMVYVSAIGRVSFVNSSVTVIEGETQFTPVNVPTFSDDLSDFISYSSDNPDVCKIFGTSKVACIEGKKAGTAIVRIKNSYDSTEDEIVVNVLDKNDKSTTRINVSQSYFSLNPRSENQTINAYLFGSNVTEDDLSEIEWKISGNPSLKIYPTKGEEVTLSVVQNSNGKVDNGTATITLTHKKCETNYVKTIFVTLEEIQNYFTLDKNTITLDSNSVGEVRAKIVGASLSELAKIEWSIDKKKESDGTYTEVARLMTTSGEKCSILGIEEGTVTLTAFYRGAIQQCEVVVKGDRFFSLVNNSLILYPGQEYDLSYNIRPATYVPNWFSSDEISDDRIISYSCDSVTKTVKIKALKEGSVQLNGFVAGIGTVLCNITVKDEPKLTDVSRTNGKVNIPLYNENDYRYNGNQTALDFYSYPSGYYCKVTTNDTSGNIEVNIEENHNKPDYDTNAGYGKIYIKSLKELPRDRIQVTLTQYKDNNYTQPTGLSLTYTINSRYDDSGFEVWFVRNDGTFTMRDEEYSNLTDHNGNLLYDSNGNSVRGIKLIDLSDRNENNIDGYYYGQKFNNNNTRMPFGESESHYLIFKPKNKGQYFNDLKIVVEPEQNTNSITASSDAINKFGSTNIELKASDFHQDQGNYVSVVDSGQNCDVGFQVKYDYDNNSLIVPTNSSDDFYGRYKVDEYDLQFTKPNNSFVNLPSLFHTENIKIEAVSYVNAGLRSYEDIILFVEHNNERYILFEFYVDSGSDGSNTEINNYNYNSKNSKGDEIFDFFKEDIICDQDYSNKHDFQFIYNVLGRIPFLNETNLNSKQLRINHSLNNNYFIPDDVYSGEFYLTKFSKNIEKIYKGSKIYNSSFKTSYESSYKKDGIISEHKSTHNFVDKKWDGLPKFVKIYYNLWQVKEVIEAGNGQCLPNVNESKAIKTLQYKIKISYKDIDGILFTYCIPVDLNLYDCYKNFYNYNSNGNIISVNDSDYNDYYKALYYKERKDCFGITFNNNTNYNYNEMDPSENSNIVSF